MIRFSMLAASVALAAMTMIPGALAGTELTTVCTPNTVPVGACASVTLGTRTTYYRDPNVGQTWSYTCSPFGLACVLTPDVTYTTRSVTTPWVDTTGTYAWCTICAQIIQMDADSDLTLLP